MNKGQSSTIPYPDAREAEKIMIDAKSEFLKTYASRLADRKTGLCYADVVRNNTSPKVIEEEKYTATENDLRQFRNANLHLYLEAGIYKERNPLDVTMEKETSTTVELPPAESLFKHE
jgi:hypothetical protein